MNLCYIHYLSIFCVFWQQITANEVLEAEKSLEVSGSGERVSSGEGRLLDEVRHLTAQNTALQKNLASELHRRKLLG